MALQVVDRNDVFNKPSAWRGLEQLYLKYLVPIGPIDVIVEIGVDFGFSLFHMASHFPGATVVGIDDYGHAGYSSEAEVWVTRFYPYFPKVILLKTDSMQAAKILRCTIDVLHIDGDHSYEGVRNDFELWFPMVRRGGCVMFHDICSIPSGPGKLFEELSGLKSRIEVCNGLGFWFKP